MRILFTAAAIILAVTAAKAQEQVRSLPSQSAIDKASEEIVQKLKASGELKRDTKPIEAKSTEPAPVEAKPAAAAPVEAKPVETKPAEAQAVETKPVEAKPADTKSVETKPADTKATETKPVRAATDAKPEKKRVVRKRETHEETARRLAEKYGISWD